MAPVKCLSGKGLAWGGPSFSWSVHVCKWEYILDQESHLDPERIPVASRSLQQHLPGWPHSQRLAAIQNPGALPESVLS